jgi:hypothetical protein
MRSQGVETLKAANDNRLFYVYIWRDTAGVPFYVGKGTGSRAQNTTVRSEEFKRIHALGGCSVEIVDWFIHESQAHAFEVELIARYGRRDMGGMLVNKTDGGEGASGAKLSAETRAKIAKSAIGNTRCVGRALSADHRSKIGEANRKRGQSAESRKKIGAASRGRVFDADARAKISATHLGRPKSDETRMRMVAASRTKPPMSGFKGVSRTKTGKSAARISVDGKELHIGVFDTPEEAALAYDAAVDHFWGPGPWYRNFENVSALAG